MRFLTPALNAFRVHNFPYCSAVLLENARYSNISVQSKYCQVGRQLGYEIFGTLDIEGDRLKHFSDAWKNENERSGITAWLPRPATDPGEAIVMAPGVAISALPSETFE